MMAAASLDFEDGRQVGDVTELTRGKKCAVGSLMVAAFVAATMMGFFVLGPFINDATVTNHGYSLNKFAMGGSVRTPVSNGPAMHPAYEIQSRAVPDPVMAGDRSAPIPDKMDWVTFASSSDLQPGKMVTGIKVGQEIAFTRVNGKLVGISNRLPPTGQPAALGKIEGDTVTEPLSGTVYSLTTGKVVGKWCPSALGQILLGRIFGQEDVQVFKVREQGGKIQANINVNAKKQFENQYWRGILDAQGKVDGGYY